MPCSGYLGASPLAGFVRVRMDVAYDGTPFHGFARNPGVATVQQALEDTLSQVLRHPVAITGAGRTDAGVHARGQVVSFDADGSHFEPTALGRALNRMLGPTIAVDGIEATAPTFDARFSCTGRSYRYHIHNRAVLDPLTRHFTWHVRDHLDVEAMQQAGDAIIGTHDFSSFSKRNKSRPAETFVRTVREAQWNRSGDTVSFEITAGAFTHQMVRSLVGMCVEIGRGRREVADMGVVLRALSRESAPSPAPSRGLVLWRAHYD
ncbi:MAG: tRNA pseudouridine(38-40) synthase TruA [Acidimicrobiaceae bacterium]|nr:tRNA pseudouridine(38-40) synthase TruA [Acidimicrobiia bacterium]MCY4492534.1 tRNA pseudouridine(38-40) synthase TruA [Acidimicrobiaceae bacterium]